MELIKKIGNGIFNFLSFIAFFWGTGLILTSIFTPSQYALRSASAVQITQVYSEAMMYGLQGIGLILFSIFIYMNLNISKTSDNSQLDVVVSNTSRTNTLLTNLGKALTKNKS